ncbi:MAG: hypothetical protein F6K28_00095 [Microcoleus sp. SIO2G3]|nr:hypothetical protein [Microcoleus sp. SIO2G3]
MRGLETYQLLLLVGEARIVLKRHTLAQAIVAALSSIVLAAIRLLSFVPGLSYILTGEFCVVVTLLNS